MLKEQLRADDRVYRLAKKILNTVMSIPYALEAFKPKPKEKNLMLGFSGQLKGWLTFDIIPGANYLADIRNLNFFKSDSMKKIYASHVLEHVNCNDAKVVLREIHRVLMPGGEIFLAVPDMINLTKLLETEFAETTIDIIFGVNRPVADWHPQHQYGYTKVLLEKILNEAGFVGIEEFEPFLNDTTHFYVGSTKVSLCLKARKGTYL